MRPIRKASSGGWLERETYGKDPHTTSRQTEVFKRGASGSATDIRIDDQLKDSNA